MELSLIFLHGYILIYFFLLQAFFYSNSHDFYRILVCFDFLFVLCFDVILCYKKDKCSQLNSAIFTISNH